MTKLVLEEGKFYRNRKGEKVGPVTKVGLEGSNIEWGSGSITWCADGREFMSWESNFDLIEEWKEEPVNKFNVGDKVKVLRQDGVIHTYFDSIDCEFEVVSVFNTREYNISDGHFYQTVHEDDLAPYTPQESPQEDDEWGPWTEDFSAYSNCVGLVIAEFNDNGYLRHKLKKPVVKNQIEVGGSYVTKNSGTVYKCIYIERDKAWMVSYNGNPAYVWTLEGKSISLNENYNIDFSQNPKDQVPF